MSVEIAYYLFEGPYDLVTRLKDARGVYCVLCILPSGVSYPVDAGESENVKNAIERHERKACWVENCKGTIAVAVLYTPDQDGAGRVEIVRNIRAQEFIPCGEQSIL